MTTSTVIALTLSLITGETKSLSYESADLATCTANGPYISNLILKEVADVYEVKYECKVRIEE